MLRKALLRTALATLLVASAAQAQTLDQTLSGCNGVAPTRTIQATPSNYRSLIAGLLPGDRLQLAAGTYTQGLPLHNKHGEPGKCIVIEGPASGSPALFTGSDSWNVVSLKDSSYIALRNLSLDGQGKGGDGIKAEATAVSVHHILIERLSLKNFNQNYLVVGISTKCPAWNWVVRHNTISSTGTGMYFGNSNGEDEFVNSLVEHNLVYDTLDYNAQFKHQLSRSTSIGVPSTGTTIIRHNTFSKETGSLSGEGARPNLLVGHWPLSGSGSSDIYEIYGNLFYENPYEALFQGEGNIAFHDNLLVNRTNEGVRFQAHNSVPRRIEIFNNTIVAAGNGIRIASADPAYQQRVIGNAVFAGTPLTGGQQSNNVTGTYAAASTYLNNPMAALGSGLDLYPKTGQLQGTAIDYSIFSGLLDSNRDFNSRSRIATYRGAYSGDGVNPGWTPTLAIKPEPSAGSGNVLQNGVPVSGISGATGSQQFWTMTVPSGASNLQFQTSGGTGDADLYVRFGSAPTTSTYDCGPVTSDNNETCSFPSPAAGTWHVMVEGYGSYSGATLVGSYQTGSTGPTMLQNGVPVSGISGATGSEQFWAMTVPSGASNLQFQTSGGTGDADLYVRFGSAPTTATYDCGPVTSDNNETCSFPSPAAGTWHVMVHGYGSYSGATLVGSYQICNSISDVEPNNSTGAPQPISGTCSQISGTFLNDATNQVNDYFRVSLPAGRTVTALLNGLTVDYDLEIYNAAGILVADSTNSDATPDQTSWTNAGASAVNVYIRVYRYSSTRTTYQLRVSY
ncbi:MAG TPA: pre-peptidase C-terminal domain-containing protein [Thermoanaerobaculia bacterium]|nr:pre-peptidase C-terminal domain-containing protein [Thermoanaerobaculia bacterium]